MDAHTYAQMQRKNRENPPEWKRKLVRSIDGLGKQPGALDLFRKHIRTVATALADQLHGDEGSGPKKLMGPGPELTLPEKIFVLGAFHDVFCQSERLSPIIEWEYHASGERWWRHPDFGRQARYRDCMDDCADLPDEKLNPDMLRRYVEEVEAALGVQENRAEQGSSKRKDHMAAFKDWLHSHKLLVGIIVPAVVVAFLVSFLSDAFGVWTFLFGG